MAFKLLIAEDEDEIRELLKSYLEKEGYEVIEAHDGIEAIKAFYDHTFDLVLLDVMMPKIDGYEVLKKIREKSTLPVIFITARSEDVDKLSGFGHGADDYICKPFSFNEISMRIHAHLRRCYEYHKDSKQSSIVNGDLYFDTDRFMLFKNGTEITLNPKELGIVKLFMENPNVVFTKKQLYELIWKESFYGDSNTIMVHMSHIRDKIEDDPKIPKYVKTIRGIGYRMEKINERRK